MKYVIFNNKFAKKSYLVPQNDPHAERGSASLWAILGILGIIYFTREGYKLLGPTVHPIVYWAILGVLTVLTIVAMGSSMHMRSLGWKSKRALRRELASTAKRMELTLVENHKRLSDLQSELSSRQTIMTKKGIDEFALAKKILNELEERYRELLSQLADGSTLVLIDAYEALNQDITLSGDCMSTLIDVEPIPPIPFGDVFHRLERTIADVEAELRRAA